MTLSRKEYYRAWKSKNRVHVNAYSVAYSARRRQRALDVLGGKCVRCGFDDSRALQFDHIDGGGGKSFEERRGGKRLGYYDAIARGEHPEIQLLCANCNWIKIAEQRELFAKTA